MKIAHIADTHFGKDLKKVNFADVDQPFWMQKFLEDITKEQVDVVVMAGDIYDDKIQPIKAINLFGDFLAALNDLGITVFIVPGNHDQADRLAANSNILKKQHIHFASEISRELVHITLPMGDEKVVFWLLPYVEPINVRRVLGRDDITNYDSAVRELLAEQPLDKEAVNVIVAHQNVLAGATERILNDHEVDIGYSGQVDYTAFDAFDYVALGHIHGMQTVGRDTVRYAGAPLQYDFSEEGRWKGYLLVEIAGKNKITITEKPLEMLHEVMVLPKGSAAATLEELLELGKRIENKDKYYFKVRIKSSSLVGKAQEQLYAVFGNNNLLETEIVREGASSYAITNAKGSGGRSLEQNFAYFYKDRNKQELDERAKLVVTKIIDQQQNDGYIANMGTGNEQNDYKLEAFAKLIKALEDELEDEA
ncbi:MAG: exonuclease SbcCD subunit D [Phascolarctobacterium sp.]|nr:exonuclease SbcCD subunit D [Phascolarctobacterium sp.]